LLEQAIKRSKSVPICIDYKLHDLKSVTVLKLHGSCHFIPNSNNYQMSDGIMPPGWMNLDVPIVEIALDKAAYHYDDSRQSHVDDPPSDSTSMPIMSIYTKTKKTFLGKSTIDQIQMDYSKIADNCRQIFIVGVAPVFHDLHVWEPLRNTKAQLVYCGINITQDFNEWRNENIIRNHDIVLDGTWEQHFDRLLDCIDYAQA
jgi:hypothetical protein